MTSAMVRIYLERNQVCDAMVCEHDATCVIPFPSMCMFTAFRCAAFEQLCIPSDLFCFAEHYMRYIDIDFISIVLLFFLKRKHNMELGRSKYYLLEIHNKLVCVIAYIWLAINMNTLITHAVAKRNTCYVG